MAMGTGADSLRASESLMTIVERTAVIVVAIPTTDRSKAHLLATTTTWVVRFLATTEGKTSTGRPGMSDATRMVVTTALVLVSKSDHSSMTLSALPSSTRSMAIPLEAVEVEVAEATMVVETLVSSLAQVTTLDSAHLSNATSPWEMVATTPEGASMDKDPSD